MSRVTNKRLANVKTRTETGFAHVTAALDIDTPFGKTLLKETKPFFPGDEEALRKELSRLQQMVDYASGNSTQVGKLRELFMCMKDLAYTIERSGKNALSVVELFDIKSMLLTMESVSRICKDSQGAVPGEYHPEDTTDLLDMLDPSGDRLNTFYIYDDFSAKLADLRKEKKACEISIRKAQKAKREDIRRQHGIELTPKFDVVIAKASDLAEKAEALDELVKVAEDYMSVTFELAKTEEIHEISRKLDQVEAAIEEEELIVRERLSKEVAKRGELLKVNCQRIGMLDFSLAKATYALRHDCVRPEIVDEHLVEFTGGRHLQVEEILRSKGKDYCPVSIALSDGVTCITGANMGGKTISLKLAGLIPMLAQYGFFVPAKTARVGLSNYMQILIGDSQSMERGLSSFGSEMEELKEILDNSRDRSLILIDEIASGTNPVEGLALTRSMIDYLKDKPYISLITTHFEALVDEPEIVNLQVKGLSDVDFRKLDSELRRANRKERINIISKYMDYRLYQVTDNREIPKDALNIAKMLGLSDEIIEGAKKYIK